MNVLDNNKIKELLEGYYEGTSSRENELKLYLLLMDADENSPYHDDALIIRSHFENDETTLHVLEDEDIKLKTMLESNSNSLEAQPITRKRNISLLFKASLKYAAVTLLVISLVGITVYKTNILHNDVSTKNGIPLTKEEANREALQAMTIISSTLQISRDAQKQVQYQLMQIDQKLNNYLSIFNPQIKNDNEKN